MLMKEKITEETLFQQDPQRERDSTVLTMKMVWWAFTKRKKQVPGQQRLLHKRWCCLPGGLSKLWVKKAWQHYSAILRVGWNHVTTQSQECRPADGRRQQPGSSHWLSSDAEEKGESWESGGDNMPERERGWKGKRMGREVRVVRRKLKLGLKKRLVKSETQWKKYGDESRSPRPTLMSPHYPVNTSTHVVYGQLGTHKGRGLELSWGLT